MTRVTVEVLSQKSMVYSNRRENANKFYITSIEKRGDEIHVVIKYGRLGIRNPRTSSKKVGNLRSAESQYWNKVQEKKNEGYRECPIELIMMSDGSFIDDL